MGIWLKTVLIEYAPEAQATLMDYHVSGVYVRIIANFRHSI